MNDSMNIHSINSFLLIMVDWPLSIQVVSLPSRLRPQSAQSSPQSPSLPSLISLISLPSLPSLIYLPSLISLPSLFLTKILHFSTPPNAMAMAELPLVTYELRPSSQPITSSNFVRIFLKSPGAPFPLPVRTLLHMHFLVNLACFCPLNLWSWLLRFCRCPRPKV